MLLVRPDTVPEVTRRELLRLRPDRIVLLGQTDAVSDTVQDATVANASVVPVATARRGPVLFTRTNCLITEIRAKLERLNPTRIVTLGLAVDDVLQVPDC